MPTIECANNNTVSNKKFAQTLFLGASVSSFSANMGWGGQPSSVTVNLVEDVGCSGILQYKGSHGSENNHYYTCEGDDCFVDDDGNAWKPGNISNGTTYPDPPKEKYYPGKVYYEFVENEGFVSKYWRRGDPGFFGTGTSVAPEGDAAQSKIEIPASSLYSYDIIGTPVYFKMQDFAFAGLVQSWEQDMSSGGVSYRVTLEGPDNILNNSWIIIGDYAGSVFSIIDGAGYGAPLNASTNSMTGLGNLKEGALFNTFNVYGFMESLGVDYFGASGSNDNGLPAYMIKRVLQVLTSSDDSRGKDQLDNLNKNRFSPFGRILIKSLQKKNDKSSVTIQDHGIIPSFRDKKGFYRCQCLLDLDELPDTPEDFRISGSVVSVMDFVRQVTDEAGYDFYWEMIPLTIENQVLPVIKLHTVDRRFQPSTSLIQDTISQYVANNLNISSASIGEESNPSTVRSLLFGPPIQRIYQAKSYRLSYKQSSYIYHPTLQTFVNYYTNGGDVVGKMRLPDGYSQRNPDLSAIVNPIGNTVLSIPEVIRGDIFKTPDPKSSDPWDTDLQSQIDHGNYGPTVDITSSMAGTSSNNPANAPRFIPLYNDVICPFFGYQNEENGALSTSSDNNVFARIRPVWLDTWTGQLNVVMRLSEVPVTNISLLTLYNSDMFSITESEMRAALVSSQEYLIYCMEKIFKPDLFLMLLAGYAANGVPVAGDALLAWEPSGNAANSQGGSGEPTPNQPNMNISYEIFLRPNFLRDFEIIHNFVNGIAQKYYGKKYMVRMPSVRAYKDSQYFNIQAPPGGVTPTFNVYHGSGKIFYNYEPCEEGWEEPGNRIDNTIEIGTIDHYALANDNGTIPPIVGYNASDYFDRLRFFLCGLNADRFLASLGPAAANGDGLIHSDLLVELEAARAGGNCTPGKFVYPGLDIGNLSSTEYVVKSVNAHPDAFGNTINPNMAKRIYIKTTTEKGFAFLYPETLKSPRIIIDSPGLNITNESLAYETDPNKTIIANVAAEDLAIYLKSLRPGTNPDAIFVKYMLHYCSPIYGTSFLKGNPFNIASRLPSMAPKTAHPSFAAIPVKSRIFSYGPWTNYPDLDGTEIFGAANAANGVENLIGGVKIEMDNDLVPWNYGSMSILDRVAFAKIQNNTNYQPVGETGQIQTPGLPIFGIGSKFLYRPTQSYNSNVGVIHNNILYTKISTVSNFKDSKLVPAVLPPPVMETFGGTIVNPPLDKFTDTDLVYNIISLGAPDEPFAPIITSISVSFGREITSNYSFRTHTRKLSLYNKTEIDRAKQAALQNIKRNKQVAALYTNRISSANEQRSNIREGLQQSKDYINLKKLSQRNKFYDWSPSNVLIGGSMPYIPYQHGRIMVENLKKDFKNARKAVPPGTGPAPPSVTITPRYGNDPGDDLSSWDGWQGKNLETLYKKHTRRTFVAAYQPSDAVMEVPKAYEMKSLMSIDGLFSPVSFYPTMFGSTYSMMLYEQGSCPLCTKTPGTYKDKTIDYSQDPPKPDIVNYKCPYCSKNPSIPTGSTKTQLKKSAESLPPYVIASGTDINVLLSLESSSDTSSDAGDSSDSSSEEGLEIPINMFSLQPILTPYGQFRNPNASLDSRCRHSIQIVGRGSGPSKNSSINIFDNLDRYYNDKGELIKVNNEGIYPNGGNNIDFYHYDLASKDATKLMNYRFFGLRGPVTMHGWGYDIEGYPVPNEADEPVEYDNQGRPKRFVLKITETTKAYSSLDNGDVFKFNGIRYVKRKTPVTVQDGMSFRNIADGDSVIHIETKNDPGSNGAFEQKEGIYLGDIIGKGWSKESGEWVKKKTMKFYKNWGERPDIWPVGPIDLRWDDERRVWTIPSQLSSIYKFVYVTLEEDLIKETYTDSTYPARGFLDDAEYSTDPLKQNFRRVVFVKDKAGYTAPRGAKILCRYDSDSGFYEPVSKPSFVVKGIINNGNQATLEMAYIQGKRRGEVNPTMLVNFDNPFGFRTISGNAGMFTYTVGIWTLTATKES